MYGSLPRHVECPEPEVYLGDDYTVVDFETTTHSKGSALDPRNSIVLAVWKRGGNAAREHDVRQGSADKLNCVWGGEFDLSALVRDIEESSFLVAHNAKFELQWLERCGLDLTNVVVYDTMIGEYVLGGNRWIGSRLSLEQCARRHFGEGKVSVIGRMYDAGLCSRDIPASWLERYCKQDVRLTERLFLEQRQELAEKNLLPVQYNRCLLTPVLADIEKNGMQLDPKMVEDRREKLEREYVASQKELEKYTGDININSPIQLAELLYDEYGFAELKIKRRGRWVPLRTPAGRRKTDADTIMALNAKTRRQREFLEVYKRNREIYTELTKYLRKLGDCVKEAGGHLRGNFNQTNTQTHRLSSSGREYSVQFQNFPRAYKPLFTARHEGWLVGECDGAQLEFRVAAHLGRDPVALDDIVNDTDVHSVTAEVIGVSRQDAKAHTFKPLYGGQSGTADEKRYYQYFRERYEGIAEAQRRWVESVLEHKYLETEWGLRYYWPHTRMDRSGYITNTTAICNYPVQAFATAEIIPIALVCFWHRLKRSDLQMFIVNTVHDSIVTELPYIEREAFHDLSRQCLIDDVYVILQRLYGVHLTVPLGCGVVTDTHWGGKDETKYSAKEEQYGAEYSNRPDRPDIREGVGG